MSKEKTAEKYMSDLGLNPDTPFWTTTIKLMKGYASQQCKEVEIDYKEQLQQAYDEIQALQESADDYIDTLNTQIRGLRD